MDSAAFIDAFDREAAVYDVEFGRNPVGLLFRYVFQERLRQLLPPGSRVLDLGCGTGEDALFLASSGVFVHALDTSPAMVEQARAKAAARGIAEPRLVIERRAAEEADAAGSDFGGAYSGFGALNCADLSAVGLALSRALRPGAVVALGLMGRWPLPALIERALMARGEARARSTPRIAGVAVPVSYPTPAQARRLLGPCFRWTGAFALGLLLPGPGHGPWASRNPQAFGVLAALEGIVRRWPLLRSLGDHVVLEGVRV